ncbi:MAG TPA: FimV/HubP family polar landmark protein, partial [Pseudomonadales bacterium]
EFEFEDEGDSANTKLDLARAYIDMGDADGARDILNEVLDEGNTDQQQKAKAMLEAL